MITLYKKHQSGGIGTWSAYPSFPNIRYEYCVVEGGATVANQELVELNQSGRSWDQQAELMISSRASRKLQRGYKRTREEAATSSFATSSDGLMLPMLAVRIEKSKAINPKARFWVQPKLNGHRCIITKLSDGDVIARSRLGNAITTIGHLLEALKPSLSDDLPIDGELYVHGWKLQTIGSAVKRQQDNTKLLTFQAYDVGDPTLGYADRFEEVIKIVRPAYHRDTRINAVRTIEVSNVSEAWTHFRAWRDQKYEGAMLRINGTGYQPGVRSHSLLKLKAQEDGEFKILDIYLSARGVPVVTLQTDSGATFDCTAPGTDAEKADLLARKGSVLGRMMTCEFAELTEDGIPFHCVALQVREDL